MNPLVTILIPVYNAELYIKESVESILKQSHENLQVIIINDGSSDNSGSILKSFTDKRIEYIEQKNKGVAEALNVGLATAKGKYIARQDADDISLPLRIEKLVGFLEKNKEYGLVGAWAEIFDTKNNSKGFHKHPVSNALLQYELLWDSPFVSSSTLFRKDCLEKTGNFYSAKDFFEDYNMWSGIAQHYKVANIPEVLVKYREVSSGLSFTTKNSDERVINQRKKNLKNEFPSLADDIILALAYSGFKRTKVADTSKIQKVYSLMLDRFSSIVENKSEMEIIKTKLKERMQAFSLYEFGSRNTRYYFLRPIEKLRFKYILR